MAMAFGFSPTTLSETEWKLGTPRQPPISGPGGRRFKSFLPDQFQTNPGTRNAFLWRILTQRSLRVGSQDRKIVFIAPQGISSRLRKKGWCNLDSLQAPRLCASGTPGRDGGVHAKTQIKIMVVLNLGYPKEPCWSELTIFCPSAHASCLHEGQ